MWQSTAIIIAWDDSDGYYDHVTGPLVNASASAADAFQGAGKCGTPVAGAFQGRCGYGPRLPLVVISPFAKKNFVDHNLTDQTSVPALHRRELEPRLHRWAEGAAGRHRFVRPVCGSAQRHVRLHDDHAGSGRIPRSDDRREHRSLIDTE
ncbi:MAG: alkaline phosphatase family protein [Aliidongia sp.]